MINTDFWTHLTQYWDLIPAIVGGIIGALAGGIPAWLITKRQSDETLRRDREQRIEHQKTLAFSVGIKLLNIVNSVIGLRQHVKSNMAIRDDPSRSHMEYWQVLIPLIGLTDEGSMRFTSEEMAAFAAVNEYDFMENIMLLARRHSSIISSFQIYCEMRSNFLARWPEPESYDGSVGSRQLTQQEEIRLKPYTMPLNNAVEGIVAGLDEDVQLARVVVEKFGPITQRYFNMTQFASLTFPTDEALAEMMRPPISI